MRLVVAVFSAPGNSLARATIRKTWARKLQEFPGVKLVFMLGRHADSTLHVSYAEKYLMTREKIFTKLEKYFPSRVR